jgi:hypothetical protein
MTWNAKRFGLLLCIVLLFPSQALSKDDSADTIELITAFTYRAAPGESQEIFKALGLYGAKIKAVELSAKYLTHKGLLEHYGKRQHEIFCLAVDEIDAAIVDENYSEKRAEYTVRIKSNVRITNFIQAEIKNLELERAEYNFSYDQEMEQYVSSAIDPGKELSRAYRYIRQGQWRIAIIYLNHLGQKYPNWGEIYIAKAIGYYSLHDIDKMIDALKTACSLDYAEACKELQSLGSDPDRNLKME